MPPGKGYGPRGEARGWRGVCRSSSGPCALTQGHGLPHPRRRLQSTTDESSSAKQINVTRHLMKEMTRGLMFGDIDHQERSVADLEQDHVGRLDREPRQASDGCAVRLAQFLLPKDVACLATSRIHEAGGSHSSADSRGWRKLFIGHPIDTVPPTFDHAG